MLEARGISKTFYLKRLSVVANKDISLSINDGTVAWIYGNSGSGKSTLLNILTGLDTADSGSVLWDGESILSLTPNQRASFRLRHCGIIFQSFELIRTQNIFSNVAIPLRLQGRSKKEIALKVHEVLELFGIDGLVKKMPHQVSGGERQRAAIARAVVAEPRYIIADEITSGLDEQRSIQVYKILKDFIRQRQGIGIFVSHDPLIKEFADEIYKMRSGQLTPEAPQ